jgi:hypothetical protein
MEVSLCEFGRSCEIMVNDTKWMDNLTVTEQNEVIKQIILDRIMNFPFVLISVNEQSTDGVT